jgi:hypothetical protein
MTIKEQIQRELDALDESQAEIALAVLQSARKGIPLTDIYGTPYGSIRFAEGAAEPTGKPTIEIPPGIPHLP